MNLPGSMDEATSGELESELPLPFARGLDEAWREFKELGSPAARETLILGYAEIVTIVATHIGVRLPASVEQADLVSLGMFGLIDAIDKFDLDRAVKFETYASTRIRGAIIDGLRAADWAPRSVRAKARELDRAVQRLEGELQRTPSKAEVAAHLGIEPAVLRATEARVAQASIVAIEDLCLGGLYEPQFAPLDPAATERQSPEHQVLDQEVLDVLATSISKLSEREQYVVRCYYFEGMTLLEIGRTLGVTESRVSQMRSGAIRRLRQEMQVLA